MGALLFGKVVFGIWSFLDNFRVDFGNNAIHVQSIAKIPRIHALIRRIISGPQWSYIFVHSIVHSISHFAFWTNLMVIYMFFIIIFQEHHDMETNSKSVFRYFTGHSISVGSAVLERCL